MSSVGAPVNPFVPQVLPPARSIPSVGVREKLARIVGSTHAVARKRFFEACQLFNSGSFAAADAAFSQVVVQHLPDPFAVQLRINFYRAFCVANVGNYGQALQLIEPVCQQQPFNEAAFALMGRLYHVLGRYEEALNAFRRAGQSNRIQSDLVVVSFEYAASLARVGRLDEARRLLEQIHSRQSAVTKWLGQIHAFQAGRHYRATQYGATIRECDQADEHGFHSPLLGGLRGLAYLALFHQAAAHFNFTQARQHLIAARQNLSAAASGRLDPIAAGLEQLALALAVTRLKVRDYTTAIQLCQAALSSPFAPLHTRAVLALALHWNGETRAAWNVLSGAPPGTPQSLAERYLSGYLARRLNLTDEAYRILLQVYHDDPDFLRVREELLGTSYTLGAAFIATDPVRAIETLQFAHSIKPAPHIGQALVAALLAAGVHTFTRGQYADADHYFTETLKSGDPPSLTKAYLGLVSLGQAAQALQAGNIHEAVGKSERCLVAWLDHNWRLEEREDQLLQNGPLPDNIHIEWIAQVYAYYAGLLLCQATTEQDKASELLQRAKNYLEAATAAKPAPSLAYALDGILAYLFERDFVKAANQLSAAHAAGRQSAETLRILAAAAVGAEDYTRAIPAYRALMTGGNSATIAVYLAFCLWKTGSPSAAAEVLSPFAHQLNASTEVVVLCAYFNYLAGEIEQAATLVDSLAPSAQDTLPILGIQPAITYEAGIALARTGQFDEAVTRLTRINTGTMPPRTAQAYQQALAGIEHHRAVQALHDNRFESTLERAAASLQLDETRRDTLSVLTSLARFGQAVNELKRGDSTSALSRLEESITGLPAAVSDTHTSWSVRISIVRAAILLAEADRSLQAGELLEQVHAADPGFGLGAWLCGAYRWYAKHDTASATAAWEAGRPNAGQVPLLLRCLGMSYLLAGRYSEAADAYAAYRAATGDQSPLVLNYQALCLLMSDRPREALALFPAREALDAEQSFLRGYARASCHVWTGARNDFARTSAPRGKSFAALAACQIAQGWIASGDLAKANQILTEALQLGVPEIRPLVTQAQARLHRQQGVALLKQSRFREAADLLQASVDQGLLDEGTRRAWAVARFVLARAHGELPEMQTAAENLKPDVSPPLAARLLVELGCQHLRHACAFSAQPRAATDAQLRSMLDSQLNQAIGFWREALRLREEQYAIHYLIGQLAFRLVPDARLALVHLQRAVELAPPDRRVADYELGDVYLKTGQVFAARRFFFAHWEARPDDHHARQALKSLLPREDTLLRRFSRDEKAADERVASEDSIDLSDRTQLLSHIIEQWAVRLSPDQQTKARDLRRQLKQATLENDAAQFQKVESDLITIFGPMLLQ